MRLRRRVPTDANIEERWQVEARADRMAHEWGYRYKREVGPAVPVWMTEPDPDSKPYEWYERLPLLDRTDPLQDALQRACRRLHPNWREEFTDDRFRLANIGSGAFRDTFDVLTRKGCRTGLVVKRPRDGRSEPFGPSDTGNGCEALIYLHVAQTAPDLLGVFPTLFETHERGDWAIHERVVIGSYGVQDTNTLSKVLEERTGIKAGDVRGDNVGRHPSRFSTVFADYGHFRNVSGNRANGAAPSVYAYDYSNSVPF